MSTGTIEQPRGTGRSGTSTVEQVLVYLRISEDRTGEEAGVERQWTDCLGLCTRLGFEVSAERPLRRPWIRRASAHETSPSTWGIRTHR